MKLADLLEDRDRLRNRLTVPVLMSTDHAEACAAAEKAVEVAQSELDTAERAEAGLMRTPRTQRARQALAAAEQQVEDAYAAAEPHLIDFVVESVGSDVWDRLAAEHPPTKRQREQYGEKCTVNPQTFPEEAIALCLVEPEVDGIEDVRKLRSHVPDIVWQQLYAAVLRVNRGSNRVPLSLTGSAATESSAGGSEQPSSSESP